MLAPFVVVDAVVDVASPPPGCSAITATPLLESVSELLQKESVLFDLGLKLTELLQVKASKFLVGGVLVPRCRGFDAWRCGVACPLTGWGAIACPFILIARSRHLELDVEALTSGILSAFVIRVGVAEAVVARGHEAAHGFRVAKPGEVRSSPRIVLLQGVSMGVGRGCGEEVEGETLVAS